ncbi:MAG: M48 family metalloprotease [Candidatus Omnitrophica bacterium]|nr:M48 family metalloprotease [Candidatus Omnitrophota bacterium]
MDVKQYHRAKLRCLLAEMTVYGLSLLLLLHGGLSLFFEKLALRFAGTRGFQLPVYMACVYLYLAFCLLPFRFYSSYLLEKRANLSNEKRLGWMREEFKRHLLSCVFFIGTVEAWFFLVRRFPDAWWVAAGTGWFLLCLFLTRILPVWIMPLFYPLRILRDEGLRGRILELCRRLRLKGMDVYEWGLSKRTKKANALLAGWGRTRRILLSDTLLSGYDKPEIEMVVAHELAHHLKRHIVWSLAFQGVFVFGGLGLLHRFEKTIASWAGAERLTDLSVFPLLLFLAFLAGIAYGPLQNAFSRRHENQADRFALRLLPSKEVFISLMRKLARQNYADPDPHPLVEFFLYDHPSVSKRIQTARLDNSGNGV